MPADASEYLLALPLMADPSYAVLRGGCSRRGCTSAACSVDTVTSPALRTKVCVSSKPSDRSARAVPLLLFAESTPRRAAVCIAAAGGLRSSSATSAGFDIAVFPSSLITRCPAKSSRRAATVAELRAELRSELTELSTPYVLLCSCPKRSASEPAIRVARRLCGVHCLQHTRRHAKRAGCCTRAASASTAPDSLCTAYSGARPATESLKPATACRAAHSEALPSPAVAGKSVNPADPALHRDGGRACGAEMAVGKAGRLPLAPFAAAASGVICSWFAGRAAKGVMPRSAAGVLPAWDLRCA